METSELRHLIIERLIALDPEKVREASIDLWERIATQIIFIVGEGGFNSLYARSVYLTQSTFPWLGANSHHPQNDQRFVALKMSFEGQTPMQVSVANSRLLIIFTDTLASLIGEELTTNILRLAWGDDISDSADREFQDE